MSLRALKGLWWAPRDYFGWASFLRATGYNLLLVCYTAWPELSLRWRHPLPSTDRATLRALADEATAAGIELGVALNPCIGTQSWAPKTAAVRFHPTVGPDWFAQYWRARRRDHDLTADAPLRYEHDADLSDLFEQFRIVCACGVRVLVLCLDDIHAATETDSALLGRAHARLVGGLYAALQRLQPAPRVLLVPTYYWTVGLRAHTAYAAELSVGLENTAVDIFWTGEQVRSHAISGASARAAAGLLGRRPVVWLNYGSNDAFRFALQLPPAPPPAADLMSETAGLLVNPMRQVGLSRLHALVMGAYLRDPSRFSYGPALATAAQSLAGSAGPLLERLMTAWSTLPDPRHLPRVASEREVQLRVSGCIGQIDAILPNLLPMLPADARAELQRGVDRVRLIAAALEIRRDGTSGERARFLARLAETDEETACDARAVLSTNLPH